MQSMKSLLLWSMVLLTSWSHSMEEITDFGPNPGRLNMFLHVPSGLSGPAPMVVALHGCSQSAQELADITGWNELADRYGFVVLYPEQRSFNNVSSCFNWFLLKDIEGENGELASIRSMMDHSARLVSIDAQRIFAYGVSAGAAMANSLMVNFPLSFNAGAILAGGPHGAATNAYQAARVMNGVDDLTPVEWGSRLPLIPDPADAPRVIIFQGLDDNVVAPSNAAELVDQWSFIHATDVQPDAAEAVYEGNANVKRTVFGSANFPEAIVLYEVKGLGHRILVDPGSGERQGGQVRMFSEDMDFYSTWYLAREFGLIPAG